MPKRFALLSSVFGVVAFCAFGVLSSHHLGAVGIMLAVLLAVLVTAAAVRALRHWHLVRSLWSVTVPDRLLGMAVRTGDVGDAAFVAGLRRPTIYCQRQLPDRLATGELEAVLLHERAHQRAWDPARLLLLDLTAPLMRGLPFGTQWLAWSYARREIAADRYAMDHGATRGDLASALLRLPPVAQAHVAGFTSAVDLRLRALLGEDVAPSVPLAVRRASLMLPGTAMAAMICGLLLHEYVGTTLGHVCC